MVVTWMTHRILVFLAASVIWTGPAMAQQDVTPEQWLTFFARHVLYASPVDTAGSEPIDLAYGVAPVCTEVKRDDRCRDLGRLEAAIAAADAWWDGRPSQADAVFRDTAPDSDSRAMGTLQALLAKEAESLVRGVTSDSAETRESQDIWRTAIVTVGYDRLLIDTALRRIAYWPDSGESMLLEGRIFAYLISAQRARVHTLLTRRLAGLCLKIDPERSDPICLALFPADASYATALEQAEADLARMAEVHAQVLAMVEEDMAAYPARYSDRERSGMAQIQQVAARLEDMAAFAEAALRLLDDVPPDDVEEVAAVQSGFFPRYIYRRMAWFRLIEM